MVDMAIPAAYALTGLALLLAVVLPMLIQRLPLSTPMILVAVGLGIGFLPIASVRVSPLTHRTLTEHLAELCVLIALMGVGLALDRPLSLRRRSTWRAWSVTWRLLAAMPFCIAAVALLGWALGLPAASALLLAAALSPTDPVLASDVQVDGPTTEVDDEEVDDEEVDESDEVRFALTSEAGLNDGLAFPFVYAAIFLASKGDWHDWALHWFAWEVVGKVVLGVLIGIATGWGLSHVAFRAPAASLRVAEKGEPLLALATLLVTYGVAELVGGYGFIAVFAAAMTMRSVERHDAYHRQMHEMITRLEHLLTLVALLLLGIVLADGLLEGLSWRGVVIACALVFVVRPLTAYAALRLFARRERIGQRSVTGPQRRAIAFFGVRGIGSVYYLAYALGHAQFPAAPELWATVALTIVLSVVVHGIAATPVMARVSE